MILSPDLASLRRCHSGNRCWCRPGGGRGVNPECWLQSPISLPRAAWGTSVFGSLSRRLQEQLPFLSGHALMSPECRNSAWDRIDRSTSLLAYWPPSSQEPTTAICAEPRNLKVRANSLCPLSHPARLPPRFCMKTKGPWAQGSIPLHSSVSKHIKKREISAGAK